MLSIPTARKKHRRSVENWVTGNRPLVRSETASFLESTNCGEKMALRANNSDRGGLETIFDVLVLTYPKLARYVSTLLD
jgi:hypothetical protein